MAKLFAQYLAICNDEKFASSKKLTKEVKKMLNTK